MNYILIKCNFGKLINQNTTLYPLHPPRLNPQFYVMGQRFMSISFIHLALISKIYKSELSINLNT